MSEADRETASSPTTSPYRIAFDEGVRSLEAQDRTLDAARSRAATLLTGATVATAFLANVAFGQDANGGNWVGVGLVLYLVLAGLAVAVLSPMWTFHFEVRAQEIIGWVESDPPDDEDTVLRTLAWYKQKNWEFNRLQLAKLHRLLALGFILLPVELAAWSFPLVFS